MRIIRKLINDAVNIFKDTENPRFLDWALFGVLAVFLFVSFMYWDLLVTTSHSINYFDALIHGGFSDLYKVNYEFTVNGLASVVCYDLPIFFIFMIWNIPLWIVNHLFSIDIINNIFCLMWMKLLLIVFLGGCGVVIKNICQEIGIKKSNCKWAMFIFLSSPLVFSSVFILCQYDIIAIFFMLLGIFAYLKGKNAQFILWFAIAIPMKLFPIFVFIPLVLLKEKRILSILYRISCASYLLLFSRLLESRMPLYMESTHAFKASMLGKMLLSSTRLFALGEAPLFIIAYVLICIFCYIKNLKDKEELYKYTIYISLIVYLLFFSLVNFNPYWLIYLTPFIPILLFINSKHFKVNVLLDIVLGCSGLFLITSIFTNCFEVTLLDGMLIDKLYLRYSSSLSTIQNLPSVYKSLGLDLYISIFMGIFVAAAIALSIINNPKYNDKEEKIKIERSLLLARLFAIVPIVALLIACYFS